MIPEALVQKVANAASHKLDKPVRITTAHGAGGGCINEACALDLSDGTRAFLKWNAASPTGMFAAEATGLRAIAAATPLRVPDVWEARDRSDDCPGFLLTDDVTAPASLYHFAPLAGTNFGEALGLGLAAMHRVTADNWGFDGDNFIGPTPQANGWMDTWAEFFSVRRVGAMIGFFEAKGGGDRWLAVRKDRFVARCHSILANVTDRPSLVHGDLWSGNVIRDDCGGPALIDPAAHYGHREVDVAYSRLFGGFSPAFYGAYEEAFPLDPGFPERKDLYNVYHLLNHALLFGGGYYEQAKAIIRRFI